MSDSKEKKLVIISPEHHKKLRQRTVDNNSNIRKELSKILEEVFSKEGDSDD